MRLLQQATEARASEAEAQLKQVRKELQAAQSGNLAAGAGGQGGEEQQGAGGLDAGRAAEYDERLAAVEASLQAALAEESRIKAELEGAHKQTESAVNQLREAEARCNRLQAKFEVQKVELDGRNKDLAAAARTISDAKASGRCEGSAACLDAFM